MSNCVGGSQSVDIERRVAHFMRLIASVIEFAFLITVFLGFGSLMLLNGIAIGNVGEALAGLVLLAIFVMFIRGVFTKKKSKPFKWLGDEWTEKNEA